MSSEAEAACRAISRRLWSVGPDSIEPLSGGMTNSNYKVSLPDGSCYVVRIFGEKTELLLVDRDVEEAATRMAASLGLGPAIVADLRDEGALVLEYVQGAPIPDDRMAEPAMLSRIVGALQKLHSGPPLPGTIDPFLMAETYYQTACSYGVSAEQTENYLWAHAIAERVKRAVDFRITCPCHGDLLPGNFLDDGCNIRILDWEYAGMSDPRFDLGNFSIDQRFTLEDDRRLVSLYFGEEDERHVAAIRLLRFVSAFREAIWGYVQEHISKVEFDYVAYNREYFSRMRASTQDPDFEHWFAVLSGDTDHARGA